ncbi:T-cell surface glycoprotein CD4 isoform X2 [Phaenicophaeus curvirostris]
MAQKISLQTGVAGGEVILHCRDIPRDSSVIWKYYKTTIRLLKTTHLKGKATMTERSEITNDKHLRVWDLRLSDAGNYTCEYGSQTVSISLHVFKLTISSDGYFLPNEVPELTLMQSSSYPLPSLTITFFNSKKKTVQTEFVQKKTPEEYILKLKELEAMDNGIWTCHVHSRSPLINQNISFDVKILGFQYLDLERKYATVDSTVILSWHLNFQKIKWKAGFTGQLNWKQQESAASHELLDFNVTTRGEKHETKKSNHFWFEMLESKPESTVGVKLPKVHFNHSGQYECQLAYKGRYTQTKIELVVMKVSANPVGPLPRGSKMTLICQVSSPLPSSAHLRWERVNGTQMEIKNSKHHEMKVEVNVSAAGLWNCHLMEDNDRKISLSYLVEEAPVWITYVVIAASIAGSVFVFGFACLCIISGISWQRRRQRAKRMAQARQYLLENKTCQCQHRLNK